MLPTSTPRLVCPPRLTPLTHFADSSDNRCSGDIFAYQWVNVLTLFAIELQGEADEALSILVNKNDNE